MVVAGAGGGQGFQTHVVVLIPVGVDDNAGILIAVLLRLRAVVVEVVAAGRGGVAVNGAAGHGEGAVIDDASADADVLGDLIVISRLLGGLIAGNGAVLHLKGAHVCYAAGTGDGSVVGDVTIIHGKDGRMNHTIRILIVRVFHTAGHASGRIARNGAAVHGDGAAVVDAGGLSRGVGVNLRGGVNGQLSAAIHKHAAAIASVICLVVDDLCVIEDERSIDVSAAAPAFFGISGISGNGTIVQRRGAAANIDTATGVVALIVRKGAIGQFCRGLGMDASALCRFIFFNNCMIDFDGSSQIGNASAALDGFISRNHSGIFFRTCDSQCLTAGLIENTATDFRIATTFCSFRFIVCYLTTGNRDISTVPQAKAAAKSRSVVRNRGTSHGKCAVIPDANAATRSLVANILVT